MKRSQSDNYRAHDLFGEKESPDMAGALGGVVADNNRRATPFCARSLLCNPQTRRDASHFGSLFLSFYSSTWKKKQERKKELDHLAPSAHPRRKAVPASRPDSSKAIKKNKQHNVHRSDC
ncbi:hypothetical protein AVEN_260172-1 [Araneus ventricosus]|uniref:Uncharacterized protein n=1 Tax=Araneus ventricosus TaxID=182803 RepID=A0A4Y2DPT4_ARAVE|nr:hypothetical protein AVEN_260172-1 [Araneus ventricosus]